MSTRVFIQGEHLIYGFPVDHELGPDVAIDVYADDYLVGSDSVRLDELTGEATARISLQSLPPLSFPAALRGVIRDSNEEQPVAVVERFEDLLKSIGATRASAQIVGVQPDRLRVEVEIETLPAYAREFLLFVNNTLVSVATSVVAKHESRATLVKHKLDFELATILRDNDYVEIVEQASETIILAMTITWLNLMGPVLAELRGLRKDVKKAIAQGEELRSRLEVMSSLANDKFFLDRLDLYYFLLTDRVDREMQAIHALIGPPASEALEDAPEADPSKVRLYKPAEIEGVGFHNLESMASGEWRWFGPKVTLIFKNLSPSARQLRLTFSQIATGVDFELTRGVIDGVELQPSFRMNPGRNEMMFPFYRREPRADNALIAHITFSGGLSSESDTRVLSAAFLEAEIIDG